MVTSRFPSNLGVGSRFKKRNHMVYHDFASKVAIAHLEPYPNNPNHQNYGCCVCTITDMIYIYTYIYIYPHPYESVASRMGSWPCPGLGYAYRSHGIKGVGAISTQVGTWESWEDAEFPNLGVTSFTGNRWMVCFFLLKGVAKFIYSCCKRWILCVYIYIHIS